MRSKKNWLRRCFTMALSALLAFFAAFSAPGMGMIVHAAEVTRGENIPYNRYLPGATYSTHFYTVDGRAAYCIESEKQAVPSGSYAGGGTLDYPNAPMLVLALHYGYGGSGAWQMKQFFKDAFGIELSDEQQYLYTHIVANYAYVGANMSSTPGQFYKGLSAEIAEAAGINDWIRFLGRVLGGESDYTGQRVSGGYIQTFDTGTQTIGLMGEIQYSSPTPDQPVIPDVPVENVGKITVTKNGKTLSGYENGTFIWEQKGLPGAEFDVFASEAIVSNSETKYEKDALVGHIVTDDSGSGVLENLYPGTYAVKETVAPKGYLLNEEAVTVTLTKDDSAADAMVKTVSVFDEKKNMNLNLSKTDAVSGEPLSGAEFGLFCAEEISSYAGDVLVHADEMIAKVTSAKDGKIKFDMDLPYGKYYVKELNAPYGYTLSGDVFQIDFSKDAEGKTVSFAHVFSNALVTGKLSVIKEGESLTAYADGKFVYENTPLSGAEFDLFYEDGEETVAHLITGEDGTAEVSGLALGTYHLKETKAPEGMILNDTPVDFTIEYAGQTTPVVVITKSIYNEREKIKLNITKTEAGSGKKLSGGMFELINKEDIRNVKGEVIVPANTSLSKASAKDGVISFEADLPHGLYYIKETKEIPGYYPLSAPCELDLSYGKIPKEGAKCVIENNKIPEEHHEEETPAPKVLGANKNNYVTEDNGLGGSAVLIDRSLAGKEALMDADEAGAAKAEAGFRFTSSTVYGILLMILGGVMFLIGRIYKKKGEKNERR